MLGLRYHVASLAAVFLALAVGILLGVAISGKVSDAENSLQQRTVDELRQDLENARTRGESAQQRGEAAQEVLEDAYPALMAGRLQDRTAAVLFLGPVDGNVRSEIEQALIDADSGSPARVIAIDVPVDPTELERTLEGDEVLAAYASTDGDFGDLGRELGRELVSGGDTPLWSALQSQLVEERSGAFSLEADGVVVMYSWLPPETDDDSVSSEEAARAGATLSLLEGVVGGLEGTGVPVVGVAATIDPQAVTELYRDQGVSSVDDIDSLAGRLALAIVLAGGEPGHYGVKDTASDGVTPPIEPVSTLAPSE